MKRFFFAFILLSTFCYAESNKEELQESLACPYIYHSVNVITGEYCEAEVDCVLRNAFPLPLKRSFDHATWSFNQPNFLNKAEDSCDVIKGSHHKLIFKYDSKDRLKIVKVKSEDKSATYGWMEFHYKKLPLTEIKVCDVETHDGQNVRYVYHKDEQSRHGDSFLIDSVIPSNGPSRQYTYCAHPTERKMLIEERRLPEGRLLINEYYDGDARSKTAGKVKQQLAPAGSDGSTVVTTRYVYGDHYTEVYDALNHKMIYRYSDAKQLTAIESYQEDALYRAERFYWQQGKNDIMPHLTSKVLEDGCGNVERCTTYTYNKHGKVVRETLYGALSGKDISPITIDEKGFPSHTDCESFNKWFVYNDENHNQLTAEGDDSGTIIFYLYDKKKKLLTGKLRGTTNHIRIREFYHYDKLGFMVKKVIDNGRSLDQDNLDGVTERKIVAISTVKQEGPSFGLPESIDELAFNFMTGKEQFFHRVVLHYNSNAQVVQEDHYNANLNYLHSLYKSYNEKGQLISVTDAEGIITYTAYDANDNIIAVASPSENTSYRFDLMNRLIGAEKWDENQSHTSELYHYDLIGNKIASIDTCGNTTRYDYDDLNRLIRIDSPPVLDGNDTPTQHTVIFDYDICDRCISATDGNGEITRKRYNARNQPIETLFPDDTKETFEYNLNGTLRKTTDRTDLTTLYQYDFLQRTTSVRVYSTDGKLINSKKLTYNAFNLLSTTDGEGKNTQIHYNCFGQRTGVTDEYGNLVHETQFEIDGVGKITGTKVRYGDQSNEFTVIHALTDENKKPSEVRYEDGNGRVLKQIKQEAASTPFKPQVSYDYVNELGQNTPKISTTDELGITTVTILDTLGRPSTIFSQNPFGQLIHEKQLRYDGNGNKIKETHTVITPEESAYALTNTWEYGLNNRLEAVTEASGSSKQQITRYFYNDHGKIDTILKTGGIRLFHDYNTGGQLSHFYASDGSFDYAYDYDYQGHITHIHDLLNQTHTYRTYDAFGQMTQEQLGNGLVLKNEYDLNGRRTQQTLPDGSLVSYDYDAVYLREIHRYSPRQELLYSHRYTDYNLQGYLISAQLIGSAGKLEYQRDDQQRATHISSLFWSENISENGYDSKGNLTHLSLEDPLGVDEMGFSYDDQNQLTHEAGSIANNYEYDNIHNRCSKNEDQYEIDTINQLLTTDDAQYIYDNNGNISKKFTLNHCLDYRYDALNRLTDVIKDDDLAIHYQYDAFGRRLTKEMHTWDASKQDWISLQTLHYIYDDEREIGAVDAKGNIEQLRILGLGHGAEIGAAIALEFNQKIFIPIHDHRGSVRCLIDFKSCQPVEFYRYSAFGEEEIYDQNCQLIAQSALDNPWRYCSKRCDDETGLIYFGKRYYDPNIGRWTTRDPFNFIDGVNRYAYVHNNPLALHDHYGLFSVGDIWSSMFSTVASFFDTMHFWSLSGLNAIQGELDFLNHMRFSMEEFGEHLVGNAFFYLTGYQAGNPQIGVYGQGEINSNVRITMINGILNVHSYFLDSVETFSRTHGNTNVHYVFRPTEGWAHDLVACFVSKAGVTSPHAERLAGLWKNLIEDMGGVEGDGLIIHYAHSLGGTETYAALQLLTPEEQKMIRVITFGSATIIPSEGLESAINYMSRRDGVGILPFLESFLLGNYNIQFIGSHLGIPLIDHSLYTATYSEIIADLGLLFLQSYGGEGNI